MPFDFEVERDENSNEESRWTELSKCLQIATASVVVRSTPSSVSAQNSNRKNRCPKYGSLKADDIKGLVAEIRTLKK